MICKSIVRLNGNGENEVFDTIMDEVELKLTMLVPISISICVVKSVFLVR